MNTISLVISFILLGYVVCVIQVETCTVLYVLRLLIVPKHL